MSESLGWELLVVGLLVVGIIIAVPVIRANRKLRRNHARLASMFQGLGRLEPDVPLDLTHQGVAFRLLYSWGNRATGSLEVTLSTSSPESFVLTTEGARARLVKSAPCALLAAELEPKTTDGLNSRNKSCGFINRWMVVTNPLPWLPRKSASAEDRRQPT